MKRWLERVSGALPVYAWLPLAAAFAWNMLVYNGVRLINADRTYYNLASGLDEKIPLISGFVVIYILAFVQWIIGYVLAGREGREFCFQYVGADIVAKTLTCICFLAVPTMLPRPELTGGGLMNGLLSLIYRLDAPNNLFPSIHCLESWFCLRTAWKLKKVPGWYRVGTSVMTLLVFASTVCLKQHILIDIPGGILVLELGLLLVKPLRVDRLLQSGADWFAGLVDRWSGKVC
ncbi:MAG: phosphatase PAP2 family protein [Lachnospiraceae bacterium]|nr:phosphatase PAP2 family protein [Lachnospiraceae bacterium]